MRLLLKITNRYSVANCLKVHVTRLFPSFPAFCCVHFLTFVSNLSIFQRTNLKTSTFSFPSFRGFVGSSGCKVNTFIPHTQIFCVKKY